MREGSLRKERGVTLLIPVLPFPTSWYETCSEYDLVMVSDREKTDMDTAAHPLENHCIWILETSVILRPPAMASRVEFVGEAGT